MAIGIDHLPEASVSRACSVGDRPGFHDMNMAIRWRPDLDDSLLDNGYHGCLVVGMPHRRGSITPSVVEWPPAAGGCPCYHHHCIQLGAMAVGNGHASIVHIRCHHCHHSFLVHSSSRRFFIYIIYSAILLIDVTPNSSALPIHHLT